LQDIELAFVMPFVDSTHRMFDMMMKQKIVRKEVYIKKNYVMFGDISGTIGLSGKINGTGAISLPGPLALKCINDMVGSEVATSIYDEEVHDGVGELINMIAGNAKTVLSPTEYAIDFTLPTIISGRGHELYHKKGTTNLSMVFETGDGLEFSFDLSTQRNT